MGPAKHHAVSWVRPREEQEPSRYHYFPRSIPGRGEMGPDKHAYFPPNTCCLAAARAGSSSAVPIQPMPTVAPRQWEVLARRHRSLR